MALFHSRILDKYYYADRTIPTEHLNILGAWKESLSKGIFDRETSHDGEFIQRILIDILGYRGSSSGNHWTLAKNQPVGSGNVDVALGNFSETTMEIFAPLELKGAKTRDLDAIMAGRNKSPVQQAWEYAMDAKGAKWVLVSNYREIRLYAIGYGRKDYEKFDISALLDLKQYQRFMLLLGAENLLGGKTSSLLKESENKEKEITNKLYEDYKNLRTNMISKLVVENAEVPVLKIIEYTQTILDRVLFVAFAEDRGLLPIHTLKSCYEDRGVWNPQPAWANFKGLFHAIDKGNSVLKIPAYNGGLFSENSVLDSLVVSDEVCEGFKTLGGYDFESDVSVNILGHIFEQSISDLEEIKANTTHLPTDSKLSKRKKDGIFYTPPFITRFIVEQSVGGWLSEKRKEIGFPSLPVLLEEDYASIQTIQKGARKGQVIYNTKIEKHVKAWNNYKEVLSTIKVLDPACGSGAFLNEVFDYLYQQGNTINNELAVLNGGQGQLFRWDTHILSNNIYGVDLNSESVEITKLSLWLKTANRNEKLTYLDDNIKNGNSLISDPTISNQAFKWEDQFAEVLKAGGFDVIVGNPPYGATLSTEEIHWLSSNYSSFEYQANTYVLFYEKGISLLKENGFLGFITPATFTYQHYFKKIRNIIDQLEITSISKYIYAVFDDADVGDTVSLVVQKRPRKNKHTLHQVYRTKDILEHLEEISYSDLIQHDGIFNLSPGGAVVDKIYKKTTPLGKCAQIVVGIKPYQTGKGVPKQTKDIVENKPFTSLVPLDASSKLCLIGSNFHRYGLIKKPTMWLQYGAWLAEPRSDAPFFEEEKIVIRQTADRIIAHLDDTKAINLNNVYNIGRVTNSLDIKYLLSILNSSLMLSVYRAISQEQGKLFAEVKKVYLEKLPIKMLSQGEQRPFIEQVDVIISNVKQLFDFTSSFLYLINSEFKIEKVGDKLNQWYLLDNNSFITELVARGAKLTLAQKSDWLSYFNQQKVQALTYRKMIDSADQKIDSLVWSIYGISPEESAML
jgi:hypothetical protein